MSLPSMLLVSRCDSCHGRFLPRDGPCPRCGSLTVSPVSLPSVGVVVASVELSATEAHVITCMGHETLHIDAIIGRSGLPSATVLQTLLGLELTGVVQQLPGKHFVAMPVDVRQSPAKE